MVDPIRDAGTRLRAAGLRVTAPRRAVWEALRLGAHLSADDVYQRVRAVEARTNLQSVYNALGDFERAGLVRSIEPAGRARLYELRVNDNHHHLICTECGAVRDVDCVHGQAPCLQASPDHGYQIAEAEVTFWGRCPDCAAEASAVPANSFAHPAHLLEGTS